MIVLAGADLDRAAQGAAIGGFANAGQLCMAAKRIVVERAVWEGFRPRLVAAVAALRVGDPHDEATDVGPLAEGRARAAARDALAEALARWARWWSARASGGPTSRRRWWCCRARRSDAALWRGRASPPCVAWSSPRALPTPWPWRTTPPTASGRRSSVRARRSSPAFGPRG